MKFLSAVLLVALTVSQATFAAGAKGAAAAPKSGRLERLLKDRKLDKETVGREKPETAAVRHKHISEAAPALATATGISETKIRSVLTFNGTLIDMVVKASDPSVDAKFKKLVKDLIDLYEPKMDIDVNSTESKQMGKLAYLLGQENVAKEYVEFATDVVAKMNEGSHITLKQAMEFAAKKYADRKGMTVAAWLKALEDCV